MMQKNITPRTIDDVNVRAPPSKAHTLRAIFLSALAKGESIINRPLLAEDQKRAILVLKQLGAEFIIEDDRIKVKGFNGRPTTTSDKLDAGESGVTARFLPSIVSLGESETIIDGSERMRTGRPITDLLDALENLGVIISSDEGRFPIKVKGPMKGGYTSIKGSISSQFISSLLLSAPYSEEPVTLSVEGELMSVPYVDMTLEMMSLFGIDVLSSDHKSFSIPQGRYSGTEYTVEGDFSNSAFFFAAAAITEGKITVSGLNQESSQGDKAFIDYIEEMGCEIIWDKDSVTVKGNRLKGITVDMSDTPDIVIPLAIVASFAEGMSRFTNIKHLRYKECDRLEAPACELRKMGIDARAEEDSLIIVGGKPKGAEIEVYNDHRMAMGFAIAGLKVEGVTINGAEAVNKSFPEFFDVLEGLR